MYHMIRDCDQYRIPSSQRNWKGMLFFLVLGIELIFSTTTFAASTAPLIQQSNITYLGAFALPTGTIGTSLFEYGGRAVTPYTEPSTGRRTLFLQGHNQRDGQVAQIEIPSSFVKSLAWGNLPLATVLQPFADVTDGKLRTAGDTYNGMPVNGMLAYNGRLVVGVTQAYGSNQVASHGVSSLSLSSNTDFKGFYPFTGVVAPPRALGGAMTQIPPEWQTSLGGTALTGNCCRSIIGATSSGPSSTVFNPDDVGVKNPVPGTTVLYYPLSNELAKGDSQNNTYNLTTRVEGIAFPPGSRSLLFFGTHGTGPYCYGTPQDCADNFLDGKGPHAPPYRDQIWAYDANDLLAVKNGQKQPWEVRPYAVWGFGTETYTGANSPYIYGAGYDPETGRLYIAKDHGSVPRIHVYQMTVSGSSSSTLTPPTGLKVL